MKKYEILNLIPLICDYREFTKKGYKSIKQFEFYDIEWNFYTDDDPADKDYDWASLTFRIKQIKNWIFSLWIKDEDQAHGNNRHVKYTVFGCDERDVDKIRPSCISNKLEFVDECYRDDVEQPQLMDDAAKFIYYVYKHKVRADYREIHRVDYNIEYHSGIEIFFSVFKYRFIERWVKFWKEHYEKKVVNKVVKHILPDYAEDELWLKHVPNHYPSYELFVVMDKLEDPNGMPFERGHYYSEDYQEAVEKYGEKYFNKLKRLTGSGIFHPIANCMFVCDREWFDNWRQEVDDEETTWRKCK